MIGATHLSEDPRFATSEMRFEQRAVIDKLVGEWTADRD